MTRLQILTLTVFCSSAAARSQTCCADPFVPIVNIAGASASLASVKGIALDSAGNAFFVAGGYTVLRLDAVTGILSTFAGNGTPGFSGDRGLATSAQLYAPTSVATDSIGNIYVADGAQVRKVSNGIITTIAGGGFAYPGCDNCPATTANLNNLNSVATDAAGNVYVFANQRVRRISNGIITEIAGFGTVYPGSGGGSVSVQLGTPGTMAVDSDGSIYIADTFPRILKISHGNVSIVAGNGTAGFSGDGGAATSAQLFSPRGVAVDAKGNLYIADTGNQRIRKVSNGTIETVAGGGVNGLGDNGAATNGLLNFPYGVAADSMGNVYIEDTLDKRIRKVSQGVITSAAGGGSTLVLRARSTGTFSSSGNMATSRSHHTATLLNNGKVLIPGGSGPMGTSTARAELYDAVSGTFSAAGNMTIARAGHIATLLPDGRVLFVGGHIPGYHTSPEFFDPSTGSFAAADAVKDLPVVQTATLLRNGKVLITGLNESNGNVAELFDPSAGSFGPAVAMACPHTGSTAALLISGKVLIAEGGDFGGCPNQIGGAEIFDPTSTAFTPAGNEMGQAGRQTETLLTTGGVLLTGGDDGFSGASSGAQVYDPATGRFTANGGLTAIREEHTATLLPDSTVLIAGGAPASSTGSEIFDPSTNAFAPGADLLTSRSSHTATLLSDGSVLISGGYGPDGLPLASAEIYKPPVPQVAPVLFSLSGAGSGQGAIWHAATGQIASPENPAVGGEALSMYTTGLIDSGAIPPRVAVGSQIAQVIYFGAAPGYAGFSQVNFLVPSGLAPSPAVSVRLTYLERPSNATTIGIQ